MEANLEIEMISVPGSQGVPWTGAPAASTEMALSTATLPGRRLWAPRHSVTPAIPLPTTYSPPELEPHFSEGEPEARCRPELTPSHRESGAPAPTPLPCGSGRQVLCPNWRHPQGQG